VILSARSSHDAIIGCFPAIAAAGKNDDDDEERRWKRSRIMTIIITWLSSAADEQEDGDNEHHQPNCSHARRQRRLHRLHALRSIPGQVLTYLDRYWLIGLTVDYTPEHRVILCAALTMSAVQLQLLLSSGANRNGKPTMSQICRPKMQDWKMRVRSN